MKYETLEINEDKEIITIKLNRPDVHNAMNQKLMMELLDIFKKISKNSKIRVVILTGKGKSFSAGADLNWMKSMAGFSKEENIKDSNILLDLFDHIYKCPKVVIGKINGHAFGGGLGLIAVCDLTVTTPNNKFAFSEIKLGIIPSVISSFIARRIKIADMRRLFITGERFNSAYAQDIGLIDYLVEPDEIDDFVIKYANIIKSSGPNAIIHVKKLIDQYEKLSIKDYKNFSVEKIAELRVSKEGQEGIKSFLEKRKPEWSE